MLSGTVRISFLFLLFVATLRSYGQGLSPRAYVVSPIHSNAVTLTYSLQDGNIVFDQGLPVSDSHGRIGTEIFSLFHSMDFFHRSANINASMPYSIGHFNTVLNGEPLSLYRSGLAPTSVRFSVNLFGAPAMTPQEYLRWHQKTLVGVSLTVSTPTGQYDPGRFVNIGGNRWAFKPEVGVSRRWGRVVLDVYGAVWLYTPNEDFWRNDPGTVPPNRQTQAPMAATELHLSYDVKPRMWFSLDGNYWHGGTTSVNGTATPTTLQANSRLGATGALPVGRHQSLKFSFSRGTYITFGGDYTDFSAAWQYSWLGRPN